MKIFVASSGRCGTGFLASGFRKYTNLDVHHEQPPVIVGSLLEEANKSGTNSEALKKKCERIATSEQYIDTAHQFMRGFYDYVLKAFDDVKVIKLVRDPLEVARSRINRGVVPGATPWLGSYDDDKNIIRFTKEEWEQLSDVQKILLDWFEHEERYHQVKDKFETVVYVSFFALTRNTGDTFKRIFDTLGITNYHINCLDGMATNSNHKESVVMPGDQKDYDELVKLIKSKGHSLEWLESDFYQRVIKRHDVYKKEVELLNHYNKNTNYTSLEPEWVFKNLPVEKIAGKRVLDLGCGDGRFSAYLKNQLGCDVVGVDFSQKRIALARERVKGVPFFCSNAYTFVNQYKGKKFDYVLMTEFLEHLEAPEVLMSKLMEISDGVIGTTPKNFPYVAHLQVYKSAKSFRKRFKDWDLKTKLGGFTENSSDKSTIFFYS